MKDGAIFFFAKLIKLLEKNSQNENFFYMEYNCN